MGTWATPMKFSTFPATAAGSREYLPMCSGRAPLASLMKSMRFAAAAWL